jgi:siroheme synthase-like protein
MTFLPIAINITDKNILLIGGGKVALEKLIALRQYSTNITIIAEEIHPQIQELPLKVIQKSYKKFDLPGFFLVYACTNNPVVNEQIRQDCQELGILVNVADTRDKCDFISPAIYKKDHLSVAINSNGIDVKLSLKVRNLIRKLFEDGVIAIH